VYVNTNELTINSDLNISNLLRLIKGKINTSNYVVALVNSSAASLENEATNTNYINSWINGNFKRSISANTSSYDFPVGNSEKSNLLKFLNNNLTGPSSLTSSFIPKPGTDAGLNVVENGNSYTAVNNGGVWKLIPNTLATGGNYAVHLYFNGFTGLSDNQFGILHRPDASSNAADWMVPTGSLLEPLNGTGRKVSDGFARRYNLSDFSQLGIGEFTSGTPCEITGQSEVCIGSLNNIYSGPAGMTTYFWTVIGAGFASSNTGQTVNIIVPNSPGTFTINLITTLNGVQSQCSKTVTIAPNPACDITGEGELCFSQVNNTYSGPGNMTTYFWTTSPGLQIVGSNSGSSVNVITTLPGPQLLTLNSTWLSGCVSQCSKLINVKPIPPCGITGEANVSEASTNNSYTAPDNMSSYSWSLSGNGSITGAANTSSVNVTATSAGNFTLTLTTELNGCSRTCNKTVTVDPAFTYSCNITGASETCNGSTEKFAAPADLDNYQWSVTGNGVINGLNTLASVEIISTGSGSYTVMLQTTKNDVSCSSQKTIKVIECANVCTYTQGFYGNPRRIACYNNSGFTTDASTLMQAAFGINSSQVFGSIANKRFFTLYRTDIINGNIYKMLPGGGTPKAIDSDKKSPFDGAYYDDENTWSLVPLESKKFQKGKIRNILLAQTITLWFNIRNSSTLESISLADDTLVTKATAICGSNIPVGNAIKFGLPHNVIMYLNGNNGYSPTVEGLFQLANDVLGGAVVNISASSINEAVDKINNAFDECRILTGTIPYNHPLAKTQLIVKASGLKVKKSNEVTELKVIAYPNPYKHQFQLQITSPVSGIANIGFYTLNGQKVHEINKLVIGNTTTIVPYNGQLRFTSLAYKVTIGKNIATGIVVKPN
jgi:hypothetical protein